MSRIYLFLFLILMPFSVHSQNIKLMTYNIRFDNPADGENSWDARKDFLTDQVLFYGPDIMGVQEALHHQVNFIDQVLDKYSYVGVGRDDGYKKGEYCAIFYNKEKFNVVKCATFWLSETPEVVSVGWDAAMERICTYAIFECIESELRFLVLNTHFDHIGEKARYESCLLILSKIYELNSLGLPVIIMGDLNLEPESGAIQLLSSRFSDAYLNAKIVSFGPEGSFNGFHFNKPVKSRIDYIFTDKKKIRILRTAILSDSKDLRYPSDHLPVFSEIEFKSQ